MPENKEEVVIPKDDKTHSEKAFRKVSDDMHKYKSDNAELKSQIDKMNQLQEDEQRANLEKNDEYKKLYEDERHRNDDLQTKYDDRNSKFIDSQKINAVKDKLGQFKRSEYNRFIDTSRIIMDNEGNVDVMTVDNEVNRLKNEYPELIKAKKASKLPNQSPASGDPNKPPLSKLTSEERMDMRRKMIEERSK